MKKIKAAGVLAYCPTERLFLINKRSSVVPHPNEWAMFGGKLEEGEQPAEGAFREFKEETQFKGKMKLIKLCIQRYNSIEYTTYLGICKKFTPVLNSESDDYKWVELEEILEIENLMPSFKNMITNMIEKKYITKKIEKVEKFE